MTCAVYTYPLLDLPQLNWLNSVFSSSLSPTTTSSAPRGSYWNAMPSLLSAEILGICLELYLHTLAHHLRLLSSTVECPVSLVPTDLYWFSMFQSSTQSLFPLFANKWTGSHPVSRPTNPTNQPAGQDKWLDLRRKRTTTRITKGTRRRRFSSWLLYFTLNLFPRLCV